MHADNAGMMTWAMGDARRAKEYIFAAYKLSKQHQPTHGQTKNLHDINKRLQQGEKYKSQSGANGAGKKGGGSGGGGGGGGGGGDTDALREQKRKEVAEAVRRAPSLCLCLRVSACLPSSLSPSLPRSLARSLARR